MVDCYAFGLSSIAVWLFAQVSLHRLVGGLVLAVVVVPGLAGGLARWLWWLGGCVQKEVPREPPA
jgi:hypothetical protein